MALVTGAARGIGFAIAARLAEDGLRVMLTDRDRTGLDRARDALARSGREVASSVADLADPTEVERLVPEVLRRWGRIDALVCNAAEHGARKSVLETDVGDWREVFSVNVFAAAELARQAALDMATRKAGSIVVLGSVQSALPAPSYAVYVASKAALEGLTRALAVELAELGIRVNCVAPGVIGTENYASNLEELTTGEAPPALASLSGLAGTPEQVAHTVAFLCSPAAGFVTGVVLPVDGGRSISRRSDPFQIALSHPTLRTVHDGADPDR